MNASLGEEIVDDSGRSIIKLVYVAPEDRAIESDDEEEEPSIDPKVTVLAALTAGKVRLCAPNFQS